MDISIFRDKNIKPDIQYLKDALELTFSYWMEICNYVDLVAPESFHEWNYPGKNYGWSFRIKDKKRAIIYLLPREKYFKTAFVFGQKAYNEIISSDISDDIRIALKEARVFTEGRGIRVDVRDKGIMEDIRKLIDVKLKY